MAYACTIPKFDLASIVNTRKPLLMAETSVKMYESAIVEKN